MKWGFIAMVVFNVILLVLVFTRSGCGEIYTKQEANIEALANENIKLMRQIRDK